MCEGGIESFEFGATRWSAGLRIEEFDVDMWHCAELGMEVPLMRRMK